MLNTFQHYISRVIAGLLISGVTIGLVAVLHVTKSFNKGIAPNQNDYENDVRSLFQIAEQLGYKEDNQLNFFREKPYIGTNEDTTKLVFSSSDSLEIFFQKVNQLALVPEAFVTMIQGKQFKDDQYLRFINKPRDLSIVLTDMRSESEISILPEDITPLVTKWNFVLSQTPQRDAKLSIHFAQLPKADLSWKDKRNGKTVSSPIVVMWLKSNKLPDKTE